MATPEKTSMLTPTATMDLQPKPNRESSMVFTQPQCFSLAQIPRRPESNAGSSTDVVGISQQQCDPSPHFRASCSEQAANTSTNGGHLPNSSIVFIADAVLAGLLRATSAARLVHHVHDLEAEVDPGSRIKEPGNRGDPRPTGERSPSRKRSKTQSEDGGKSDKTPSGYRGVYMTASGKYEARVRLNGRRTYLGSYDTAELAAAAAADCRASVS